MQGYGRQSWGAEAGVIVTARAISWYGRWLMAASIARATEREGESKSGGFCPLPTIWWTASLSLGFRFTCHQGRVYLLHERSPPRGFDKGRRVFKASLRTYFELNTVSSITPCKRTCSHRNRNRNLSYSPTHHKLGESTYPLITTSQRADCLLSTSSCLVAGPSPTHPPTLPPHCLTSPLFLTPPFSLFPGHRMPVPRDLSTHQ